MSTRDHTSRKIAHNAGSERLPSEASDPRPVSSPKGRPEKGKTPDSIAPEEEPEDEVDEAGEESFPASDAPPWTGLAAH